MGKFNFLSALMFTCFLIFSAPVQAQTRLAIAESYAYLVNAGRAIRGESIVDLQESINWANSSTTRDVKDAMLQEIKNAQDYFSSASSDNACEAYAYLKNTRYRLFEGRSEEHSSLVNKCLNMDEPTYRKEIDKDLSDLFGSLR
ncbi:hypothetical protein I8752_17970 [Nostocaceae cyanobacterium CENA369]|uniref:Uncharacterized protein n=1 Tax=Dendronalium phyllosphericum CENA369 TaxID=1725256 RepID=A0A8J7I2L0_9NOST|nr:hypothetical protein [Dendronalium phyllosphericum]MBH8574874.1 hypothetical protein [Dendronalium phyllosphericum CENA369]